MQAEKLQREALRMDKKIHGDEHPDVARDLNSLAWLYKAQVRIDLLSWLKVWPIALLSLCTCTGKKPKGERTRHPSVRDSSKSLGRRAP